MEADEKSEGFLNQALDHAPPHNYMHSLNAAEGGSAGEAFDFGGVHDQAGFETEWAQMASEIAEAEVQRRSN